MLKLRRKPITIPNEMKGRAILLRAQNLLADDASDERNQQVSDCTH